MKPNFLECENAKKKPVHAISAYNKSWSITILVLQDYIKDTSYHISIDPLGLYISRIFDESFLKPVHPTMVGENFQIYDVQITGKCICKSKY